MAKVITLSRRFPSYHPKKGQCTYFVEKVLPALGIDIETTHGFIPAYLDELEPLNAHLPAGVAYDFVCKLTNIGDTPLKYHTIRAGKRWKAGDKASLRVWSDTPYDSKQIILAPDIVIPKVLDVEMYYDDPGKLCIDIGGSTYAYWSEILGVASKNDGLDWKDMIDWFVRSPDFKKTKHFSGQMIFFTDVKTPY